VDLNGVVFDDEVSVGSRASNHDSTFSRPQDQVALDHNSVVYQAVNVETVVRSGGQVVMEVCRPKRPATVSNLVAVHLVVAHLGHSICHRNCGTLSADIAAHVDALNHVITVVLRR